MVKNPNTEAMNITKLVQMIFSAWFGYFEYVGYLPCGIHWLFSVNVSIWSLSTSTDLSGHGALSSEKSPAWNFVNHLICSVNHSTFSIHRTDLFAVSAAFYLSGIVLVAQSRPTLYDPVNCGPPGSSVHGILQARILEWVAFLLQGIFPTQGLNLCLLHCRKILNHLSHQGSPPFSYNKV